MAAFKLTPPQEQAVATVGHSVIVSAAAGSGKTAVLARRCAYLICDAPPEQRCNVDQLLVLTFTDAAAAEMRSRIVQALRARLSDSPHDHRLREQAALVDAAQISTIHSFCHWLVRRWFSELELDPAATLLDADEATLLEHEVLDTFLTDLYAETTSDDNPLGEPDSGPPPDVTGGVPETPSRAALAARFVQLIDVYGLGDDRDISTLILKLHEFVTSLPQPERWLDAARESIADRPEEVVEIFLAGLKDECARQAEHCDAIAATIEAGDPVGHLYAEQIRTYTSRLRLWTGMFPTVTGEPADTPADRDRIHRTLAQHEAVRSQIADFEFARIRGSRLPKDADPGAVQARDLAKAHLKHVKETLFGKRLKKRYSLFSTEELIDGLKQTAPFVSTIVDLVTGFRDAYASRKRRLDVLDFSDLERFAFNLLRSKESPDLPSEAARSLHRRFAQVLVDEFQDINPIQQEIIRLVSSESDPDLKDNLFVVGDVKQSIYRFRLAEPALFTSRLGKFRSEPQSGEAIALQANFRSRAAILESVNLVFRQLLLPGGGDVVYDAEAELRMGRDEASGECPNPVELHLLERSLDGALHSEDTPERGLTDLSDPVRWTPIEREAFLIGSLIHEWMKTGQPMVEDRSLRFQDIAVLLRATKVNAERMAAVLTSMGVPAFAEVGGSLFGAREIRDVLAALNVLDNFQQDIPLAAVLRSGILGEPLSQDDLVQIRCLDREAPFHETVRRYLESGPDDSLSGRLRLLLNRIDGYRDEVRCRPLADLLWDLYERQGYVAHACGLPNGVQRRANLLKLHEIARRFGSFRKQGLHRFLRFVESLEEENRDLATAPAIGESENVVRIMSIHQSKGLEFPVVCVAGLGTRFNLGDRMGRMIFERNAKIGLRAVDTERMIEYPTAAHAQVAGEVEKHTRDEELRILYVAMTRAREKLVLVGSLRQAEGANDSLRATGGAHPPSRLSIATAMTPLDWLIPALSAAPPGMVRGPGDTTVDNPLVEVHVHDSAEIAGWSVAGHADPADKLLREAAARCEMLPPDEPLDGDHPLIEQVLKRLDYVYPTLASGTMRTAVAASEFKGAFDFTRDPQQRVERPGDDHSIFAVKPAGSLAERENDALRRGLIMHRVLEHLDFAAATDPPGVASDLQRMETAGTITTEDRALVDRGGIEWFVSTPLAAAIRQAGSAYRREFQYIAAESAVCFDRSIGRSSDDQVLVRGIVDDILSRAEGIEIVDFKTDAVARSELARRAEHYRPQMELYARAMSRIWRRPVHACWLVFITARETIDVRNLTLE